MIYKFKSKITEEETKYIEDCEKAIIAIKNFLRFRTYPIMKLHVEEAVNKATYHWNP